MIRVWHCYPRNRTIHHLLDEFGVFELALIINQTLIGDTFSSWRVQASIRCLLCVGWARLICRFKFHRSWVLSFRCNEHRLGAGRLLDFVDFDWTFCALDRMLKLSHVIDRNEVLSLCNFVVRMLYSSNVLLQATLPQQASLLNHTVKFSCKCHFIPATERLISILALRLILAHNILLGWLPLRIFAIQ